MSRIQLALNVNNLSEAVEFYSKLFNTEPAKLKDGYANFAITEPPLKLVLLENPGNGGTINHLGVEVGSSDTVHTEIARLRMKACSPKKSAPRAASPRRTKYGSPGLPVRSGRSTRSWPTPTLSAAALSRRAAERSWLAGSRQIGSYYDGSARSSSAARCWWRSSSGRASPPRNCRPTMRGCNCSRTPQRQSSALRY